VIRWKGEVASPRELAALRRTYADYDKYVLGQLRQLAGDKRELALGSFTIDAAKELVAQGRAAGLQVCARAAVSEDGKRE
jgi:hypothetical protein